MAAMTKEELRAEFIDGLKNLAWRVANDVGAVEDACTSMVHGFLTMIDGVGTYCEIPTSITIVVEGQTPSEIKELIDNDPEDYDTKFVSEDTPINNDVHLHNFLHPWEMASRAFFPQVLNHYRTIIKNKGDLLPVEGNQYATKEHLLSMLDTLEEDRAQQVSKKHRWLGYIQGTLCAFNLTTVDAEREYTRRIFNGR